VEPLLPPDPGPESQPEPPSGPEVPSAIAAIGVDPPLSPGAPAFRDRGTWLMAFGVVQIILGLLAALMVPLVALGTFLSRFAPSGSMRLGQFVSGVATYGFLAVALLALGIGSVQMKRWARALTLVTSWYWLVMGALVTVLLTAVLPVFMRSALGQIRQAGPNAPSPDVTTGIMAVMLTLIIVFMAFFLVLVPIAFVVFYGRKDVAETCRRRDPVERWTDQTPLPVLGASVVFFVGALYLVLTGLTMPLFPFFGRYLTGVAGSLCLIVVAAIDAYLAVAIFRLKTWGWWLAVLVMPIRLASVAFTYARGDVMQAYAKVGMSDAQLKAINSNPMLRGHVLLWWGLISMMLFFGYIVWLKRYFKAPTAVQPAALAAPLV
jgi:hypothetical protein